MRLWFMIGKGDAHGYETSRPGASYTVPRILRQEPYEQSPKRLRQQGLLPNHPFNISLARADDAAEIVIAHGQAEEN